MDTQNSQKKSPRDSAKSKRTSVEPNDEGQRPSFAASNPEEFSGRYDQSFDMVERVRLARAAAERKMNAFSGNLENYVLVRRIVGQKSVREREAAAAEQPSPSETGSQPSFNFVAREDEEPS